MALDDYAFGADLLDAVQSRANQVISPTDGYILDTKAYVRRAYRDLMAAARWPFALATRPSTITLRASIKVVVTAVADTQLTLSLPIATSMAGRKIVIDNLNAWYRIIAHTPDTAIFTLDTTFIERNFGPAHIFQDEYPLAKEVLTTHGPFRPRNGAMWWQIPLIPEPEFRAQYGSSFPIGPGPVEAACLIRSAALPSGEDGSKFGPAPQVQIAPWPDEDMVIEFDYTPRHLLTLDRALPGTYADPTMHDVPMVPFEWRHVIVDRATSFLLLDKKDPSWQTYDNLAQVSVMQMVRKFLGSDHEKMWVKPRNSLALGCQ